METTVPYDAAIPFTQAKKKLQSGEWECGSLVPRLLQRREPLEKPGNEARNVVTTHVVTTHVATCG